MSNQEEAKESVKQLFREFIKTPVNRWIVLCSFLILLGVYLYYALLPDYLVVPTEKMINFIPYDDRASGGHSEVLNFIRSDSLVQLEFELKEGFTNPYVGVTMAATDQQPMDVSFYNRLMIRCKGQNVNALVISIFTSNTLDHRVFAGDELWYQKTIAITGRPEEYLIDLNDFRIPDWWLEGNQLMTEEVGPPDLTNVRNINISSAHTESLEGIRSFSISDMSFTRDNGRLGRLLFITELVILTVLLGIHWFNTFRTRRPLSVTVEYRSVETMPKETDPNRMLRYINEHFHEMELTLEEVAKNTGNNTRRVSAAIRERFQCNFKTYLNRLRITESKRLLQETDLSIGEVAYKVGFNNQSHFNRVFKEQEKVSPSQFRNNTTT